MSSQMAQQLLTAWMGTRILRKLQSAMYDHVQELSLSFFDEMEVGRIISRLTSDVQVVQDLLTTGSLSSLSNVLGISIIVGILLVARLAAGAGHLCGPAAADPDHDHLGQGGPRGLHADPHDD